MKKLSKDFLYEFLRNCILDESFFNIVKAKMEYKYFPSEPFKKIWKYLNNYYESHQTLPSAGILAQNFQLEEEVLEVIKFIKRAKSVANRQILTSYESFIKQSYFVNLYNDVGEMWSQGNKEDAIKKLSKLEEDILKLNILEKSYDQVYKGFFSRQKERANEQDLRETYKVIPTLIRELDDKIKGGVRTTDTLLFTAESGKGKSRFLRHIGVAASSLGFIGLHEQMEGTKKECLDYYDACWIGTDFDKVEKSLFTDQELKKLKSRVNNVLVNGGEVYVAGKEKFNQKYTMADVYQNAKNIFDRHGRLDFLIIDYLEKIEPAFGKFRRDEKGERMRREQIAQELKDICVEFNCAGYTATQAMNIPKKLTNLDDFYISREHISEFKKLVDSFSIHITYNQTDDEYCNNEARLYGDKVRHSERDFRLKIEQDYSKNKFYV